MHHHHHHPGPGFGHHHHHHHHHGPNLVGALVEGAIIGGAAVAISATRPRPPPPGRVVVVPSQPMYVAQPQVVQQRPVVVQAYGVPQQQQQPVVVQQHQQHQQPQQQVVPRPHFLIQRVAIRSFERRASVVFFLVDVFSKDGVQWQVSRRYSQFDTLANAIATAGVGRMMNRLPSKSFFGLSESALEERRSGLEAWLQELVERAPSNPRLQQNMNTFLEFSGNYREPASGPLPPREVLAGTHHASAPPASAPSQQDNAFEQRLANLDHLKQQGLISEAEYVAKRSEILNSVSRPSSGSAFVI